MTTRTKMRNLPGAGLCRLLLLGGLLWTAGMLVQTATAQGDETIHAEAGEHGAKAEEQGNGAVDLTPLAAALAISMTALATGIAQSKIGAAGVGAIAENPKNLGAVIMLVALPETVVILGFVLAFMMIS